MLLKKFILSVIFICSSHWAWAKTEHVVLISFDGLRPDAVRKFEEKLPNFSRLIKEGAYTFNARTDVDYTITLPNHACMLTGRSVAGTQGHGLIINTDTDKTLHELKGAHVESIFDVLQKHGLTSGMAASKSKFDIYAKSFPIGATHITEKKDQDTLQYALKQLGAANLPAFMFIHFAGTDDAGHRYGWNLDEASPYMQTLFNLDGYLGWIMEAIDGLNLSGKSTVLIVTADHGGTGKNHGANRDRRNYTIPFMVWGAGISQGKDLYKINGGARRDPGHKQIPYAQSPQPIRNGDAANLALRLLGLECVEQSTIGCAPPLVVEQLH